MSSVADEADASRRQRDEIARLLQAYQRAQASGISQRDFAASQGIPPSSLQYWLTRQESIAAPPEAITFFEGPVQGHFILDLDDEFRWFQPSKMKIPDAWNGAFS